MATTDRYILEIETAAAERNLDRTRGLMGTLGAGLARVGPLAAAAGAALGGMAAVGGIQNRIDEMDALAKQARQAGVDTQEQLGIYQTFGTVLADAGISQDEYGRAISQTMDRLQRGGAQAEAVMAALGPALRTANGELKSGPELLQTLLVAFRENTITAEQFQAVVGTRVGPLINRALGDIANSAENMQAAMDAAAQSTDLVDQDALANSERFNDNMAALGRQVSTLGTQIVTALLPHLVNLTETVMANAPAIIDGVKTAFTNLEPVFSLIGTVLTNVVWPIMSKVFEILGQIATAISPLVATVLPALQQAFEFAGNAIQFVIDKITAIIEWFGQVITKAGEMGTAVKNAFSEMTGGVVERARSAYEGVTGWFGQMYDRVVGNSIVPDMARGVLSSFEGMSTGMVSLIGQGVEGVKTAFTQVAQAVGSKFEEITGVSLSAVREQVSTMASTISNAVSSLASSVSSRVRSIWNNVSSTASRIGSSVGNLFSGISLPDFSGFFANGGMIPPRSFGVVGERGPELVSGPANVTPLGNSGPQQVIYQIQAVDASSFRSLVARDPEFIHAVVQRGARRNGGMR